MGGRKYRWLTGLLCGLLLSFASARAQDNTGEPPGPSYVEIQPPGNSPNVADLLRERLDRLQGISDTQQLLNKLLGDPQGGDLLERARKLGVTREMIQRWKEQYGGRGLSNGYVDPQLRDRLLETLKGQRLPPEQQRRIEEAVKGLKAKPPDVGPDGQSTPPPLTEPNRPDKRSPVQTDPGDNEGSKPMPKTSQQVPDPGAPAPEQPPVDEGGMSQSLANWLLEQSRHIQDMEPGLRNSAALQHAIEHLDQYLSGQSAWHPNGEPGGFTDRLGRLIEQARNKPLWSGGSLPHLPDLKLPSLPHPSLPSVHAPRVHLPGVHTPHVRLGTPSAGIGKALLWFLVIGVAVLLIWQFSRVARPVEWFRSQESAGLGPWPVNPAAVRTRAQLVQAFEYLSLLRLGPAARSWNHLQIAVGLGGDGHSFLEAADELAALYEQARYVPGEEPLSPEAVLTARRTLTLLAGVAHA